MRKLLLDTNVLIDDLRQPKENNTLFKSLEKDSYRLFISAISLTELWAGESIETPLGKKLVNNLLGNVETFPLTDKILKRAGEEMRKDRSLYLGDALVVATAITFKVTLVTLNTRHFEKVRNVEFFDLDKYKKLS